MVASDVGPEFATTRHVLLTLGTFMSESGGSCFPSTRKIAVSTALSERSVCTHLKIAEQAGWIKIFENTGQGQAHKRNSYQASIPKKALKEVQHVEAEGAERDSAAYQKGTEPLSKGTEPDDKKALKEVQSNISVNRPKNIPPDASALFVFYVQEIQPSRKSKNRAVKNIAKYLKRGISSENLKAAIKNYKSTLNGTAPEYRKDPANFFGINEVFAEDFYPENFKSPTEEPDQPPARFDFSRQFHEE